MTERNMATSLASSKAIVNFARDRNDAGKFSNWDRKKANQNLEAVELEIVNVRELSRKPTIGEEGFAYVRHAVAGDWDDPAWVEASYVPSCLDVVKQVTGAKAAVQMYRPFIRSAIPKEGSASAAGFIHLDQPRAEYSAQARDWAAKAGMTMSRGAIYNVWKAISPPPQSMPLGICDRRDVSEDHYVRGLTVENHVEAPYIGIACPAPPPKMYYVPDMALDESLVFTSADFDPSKPLGCPHQAISLPPAAGGALVPRVSIEVRVLALFD